MRAWLHLEVDCREHVALSTDEKVASRRKTIFNKIKCQTCSFYVVLIIQPPSRGRTLTHTRLPLLLSQ